jgi:transcriptional regulator with XRE-family HTH domain
MTQERPAELYPRAQRFGRLLYRLRRERNLSQVEVARRAGLGPSTVNQWEKVANGGKLVGMPHPDSIRAIARGLATDWEGEIDEAMARQLHLELMAEIGYLDPPAPCVVSIPRAVMERLARLGIVTADLGLTGRPWTEADTANVLAQADQLLRELKARSSEPSQIRRIAE